jgi:hypothetical protein
MTASQNCDYNSWTLDDHDRRQSFFLPLKTRRQVRQHWCEALIIGQRHSMSAEDDARKHQQKEKSMDEK